MGEFEPLIHAFNAGEIAEELHGRVDQPFYRAGAKKLFNAIARVGGAAECRPGTRYVAAGGVEAQEIALMDFEVATEQAYIIECGDRYARMFKDKAPLSVPATSAAVTNGDFAAGIAGWTDRSGIVELPFDAETVPFTIGLVVTQTPSAAFGTILSINKAGGAGPTGTLTLTGVTGTFVDNQALADSGTGAATANIPAGLLGVAAAISHDAVNARLSLDGLADDYAWAEQSIATADPGVAHLVKFAVHGVTGDVVELRIGSTATGNDIAADVEFVPGWHCYEFTPPASPFYLQFRRRTSTAAIDDIAIVNDTILTIDTPYLGADVRDLHWAQSFDVMFIAHVGYPPHALARQTGAGNWSLGRLKFTDGPYLNENAVDSRTLKLTGAGPWGLGDTGGLEAVGHVPFLAGHVGSIWRLAAPASIFAWVTVTAFTDSAHVTVRYEVAIDAALQATATASWREGLWSDARGYPATVTFYEGRLTFGGAAAEPWSINASATELFLTFKPDVGAGDAIRKVLAGNGANAVRWLLSGEYLYAGTSKTVMRIGPRDTDTPLSPDNTPYKVIEGAASAAVRAVLAASHCVYVGRHGMSLHAFANRPAETRDAAEDLSLRARHISERGLAQMVAQAIPRGLLWLRLDDGGLAALTFVPTEKVVAWTDHAIAGSIAGPAIVESIAGIPGAQGDEVWLLVKRTIGGVARRYIEVMEEFPRAATPKEDLWHVDCGVTYSGVATLTIAVPHLEGEMVNVWADGGPRPAVEVIGGVATLTVAAARAQVGLGHRVIIAPLALVPTVPGDDLPIAKQKRIARLGVQLYRSIGFDMGRDLDHLTHVSLDSAAIFGQAPELYTGLAEDDFDGDWDAAADLVLVQDQSGPLIVLSVQAEMETGD